MKKLLVLLLVFIIRPTFAYDPSAALCPIEDQNAVAGRDFELRLDSYLSTQTIGPVKFTLTSLDGDKTGLYIDNVNKKIVGRPLAGKVYNLRLTAQGAYGEASEVNFQIDAKYNSEKRPQLQQTQALTDITVGKAFYFPLSTFLLNSSEDDQVRYRIDNSKPHPSWLSITEKTALIGSPTAADAGQAESITVVAKSNAGGDSLPLTINFTVNYNPDKKPVIQPYDFKVQGGQTLHMDLRKHVWVQGAETADDSLKVSISHVTPAASWLSIEEEKPTVLTGVIPHDAIGKDYLISLMAETQEGGKSEIGNIVMQVKQDPAMTPTFINGQPSFPRMIPGQPFEYDFTNGRDGDVVSPSYKSFPYTIEFAEGYDHPGWLHLENNKLYADEVPNNESGIKYLWFYISNKPGGKSNAIKRRALVVGFVNSDQFPQQQQ